MPRRTPASDAPLPTAKSAFKWQFPTRIRRSAFNWKSSRVAVQRIGDALSEIQGVARHDPVLAAEGAVRFIERLSPALEFVDSSSGALGGAVNQAIDVLVPVIVAVPVTDTVRDAWLERLFTAQQADEMPYIEILATYWGQLCVTPERASAWADRLIDTTRMALNPDKQLRGHYHATTACLDALLHSGRYAELHELLKAETFWPYKRWSVKALAAEGKAEEAIQLAESCRGNWTSDADVNRICEDILLSQGRTDEAYRRYGVRVQRSGTYLAMFRAVAKKYPTIDRSRMLTDLIAQTPGEEGKWFAAAKDLKLYDIAIDLVRYSPCDPKTLTRAARDFADSEPAFALEAGLSALYWLTRGHGYDVMALDVLSAHHNTLKAAQRLDAVTATEARIRELVSPLPPGNFVRQVLERALGLS